MLMRWKILALGLAVASALAFTGCGDDDDGDNGSGTPTAIRTATEGTPDSDRSETPESDDDDGDEATPTEEEDDDERASPPTSTPDDRGPACDLLSEVEIEDILGVGVSGATAAVGGCSFSTDDFGLVGLSYSDIGPDGAESFELSGEFLGGEDVPGIGDDAYWVADLNQLNVRAGSTHIFLSLIAIEGLDDPIETAKELVEVVIPRLE